MMNVVSWLLFVTFIVGLTAVAIMLLRGYMKGARSPVFGGTIFEPRPRKRLGIVEEANIDGRRKLVIVRRDGVEHLVMVGGPVDIVIENGIDAEGEARKKISDAGAPRVVHSSESPAAQSA